jgi:hypothetical protein
MDAGGTLPIAAAAECVVSHSHGSVWDVLWSALFLFITWFAGQAFGRFGLAPLVRRQRATRIARVLPSRACAASRSFVSGHAPERRCIGDTQRRAAVS